MSIRFSFMAAAGICAMLFFCSKPTDPMRNYDNAEAELVPPEESVFIVGDTVALTINLSMPHLIDYMELSFNNDDTTIICRYDEMEDTTINLIRILTQPGKQRIILSTVLKNDKKRDMEISIVVNGFPAEITADPPPALYLTESSSCSLSVAAEGTEPLSYQWFKGNVELEGETAPEFVLEAFTGTDTGAYWCAVMNEWGNDTSKATVLVMRNIEGKPVFWNQSIFNETLREGDTLRVSLDGLFTKKQDGAVTDPAVVSDDECCFFEGDSVFVYQAGVYQNGRYTVPVSIGTGNDRDTAAFRITVSERYCILSLDADSGDIIVTPQQEMYRLGDTVLLEAVADEGFVFFGWQGDISGNSAETEVVILDDMAISAWFWSEESAVCDPVEDGRINDALRKFAPADKRPKQLCPTEGFYEDGHLRFTGKIRIVIK